MQEKTKTSFTASQSVLDAVDGIYAALKAASSVLSHGRPLGIAVAISSSAADLMRQRNADADAVLGNVHIIEDVLGKNEMYQMYLLDCTKSVSPEFYAKVDMQPLIEQRNSLTEAMKEKLKLGAKPKILETPVFPATDISDLKEASNEMVAAIVENSNCKVILKTPEQAQILPIGWTESTPGGMAINPDSQIGGIIDQAIADNKWFIIFNTDRLVSVDRLESRNEAFEIFAKKITSLDQENAVDNPNVRTDRSGKPMKSR